MARDLLSVKERKKERKKKRKKERKKVVVVVAVVVCFASNHCASSNLGVFVLPHQLPSDCQKGNHAATNKPVVARIPWQHRCGGRCFRWQQGTFLSGGDVAFGCPCEGRDNALGGKRKSNWHGTVCCTCATDRTNKPHPTPATAHSLQQRHWTSLERNRKAVWSAPKFLGRV